MTVPLKHIFQISMPKAVDAYPLDGSLHVCDRTLQIAMDFFYVRDSSSDPRRPWVTRRQVQAQQAAVGFDPPQYSDHEHVFCHSLLFKAGFFVAPIVTDHLSEPFIVRLPIEPTRNYTTVV